MPVNSRKIDGNHNRGAGTAPAENHVLLLEDEPSHCQREGKVWKLKEIELQNRQGMITASREPKQGGDAKATEEEMTFDAATRIWRGRECLRIEHLIADGIWPADDFQPELDEEACLLRSEFPLCPRCQAEYDDPTNRRFHAQPNACPDCGPQLALWNNRGQEMATRNDALHGAADAIRQGLIVAVKGVGGFLSLIHI